MKKRTRKSPAVIYHLTDGQKMLVKQMLFGPYKNEWRNDDGIVENEDKTIAKRLAVSTCTIANYTSMITEEHFREVSIKNNINRNGSKEQF